jgi:hypothetical protein
MVESLSTPQIQPFFPSRELRWRQRLSFLRLSSPLGLHMIKKKDSTAEKTNALTFSRQNGRCNGPAAVCDVSRRYPSRDKRLV